MNERHLIERPKGDVQPGDVDAMRFVLDIDDDEMAFDIGYEPWPGETSEAYRLSRKIEGAEWLRQPLGHPKPRGE